MSAEKRVAVFGAGPGGISAVRSLTSAGHDVTWVYPERFVLPRSVYTTSTEHAPLGALIKPEHKVKLPYLRMINSRGADVRVELDKEKYFMINNKQFITGLVADTLQMPGNLHALKLPQKTINEMSVHEVKDGVQLDVDGSTQLFDAAVDATGIKASMISQVEPSRKSENFLVEYVYGGRYSGHIEHPEMILVMGPAGGTSWLSPSADDPNSFDVVYSAWGPYKDFGKRFLETADKRLSVLVDFVEKLPGVSFSSKRKLDTYCGVIRSQTSNKPTSQFVYAVGEAAGMARPTTGQSFDRSYRAGDLVSEAISRGEDPIAFYKTWNKIWNDSLFFAGTLARLPRQKDGSQGSTFDKLHEIATTGRSDRMMKKATDWFVDNRISPEAIYYLVSDFKLLSSFLLVLSKHLEIKLRGVEQSGVEWMLPPIE